MEITHVDVTPTQHFNAIPSEVIATLPTFDNTKLVAINTCPFWGIVRYTLHKTNESGRRAMALEAGGAAHEVFAAHRLYSFLEFGSEFYGINDPDTIEAAFTTNCIRVFGKQRFEEMLGAVDNREDFRTRCQQFSLTALYNCGFYDDPGDKKRTVTNIEEMCIAYMDKRDWSRELPYWDGKDFIGVELPVDVIITINYIDNYGEEQQIHIRFIGKADGLHYTDATRNEIRVHENKTASRLGDAWEMSWETNHQPTGYMIALSALLSMRISQGLILGTALPLPKSYTVNGLARVVARRKEWQLKEWFKWLLHTALMHEEFKDNPIDAPQYTHSCNRYFRPCAFVTLCAEAPDDRAAIIEDMDVKEWSPLHGNGEVTDE